MALHSTKFWDFSNQLYDKDGVTEICLNLQEELEVDVNLVLFCYWIAYFKHGPSVAEWTKIFKFCHSAPAEGNATQLSQRQFCLSTWTFFKLITSLLTFYFTEKIKKTPIPVENKVVL